MSGRDASPVIEIRLFGPPQALVDGAPLKVDTRKALAILVVLATDARAYARDELAALLWPESDDAGARGALRRTLSVMRSSIDGSALRIDRQLVELDPARCWIDLAEVDRLAAIGSADALTAAADLVSGPFLAGFSLRDSPEFDDWRAARTVQVERTVSDVLERLVAALVTAGAVGSAAAIAGRRIDLDPLDEAAHVSRMELLAASGDRAGALRQYRACVAALERELGVAPLPETTARYEAIRDAPAATSPSTALATVSARASAPAASAAIPLVGRDEALARIEAARLAAAPDGRVVAVVGEPGIGKTRLVEEAAAVVRQRRGRAIVTRAYAVERQIAYGPLVDALTGALEDPLAAKSIGGLDPSTVAALATILPGLASGAERAGDAPAIQARLLAAIAAGLSAALDGPAPGLLVVDDLHWADDASLGALAHLIRRLEGRRYAIVVTWRGEDLDAAARPVAGLVANLAGSDLIDLERLSRAQVRAVASSVRPDVDEAAVEDLWRASEGLPLYVAEALSESAPLRAGTPAGVRAVLSERLASIEGLEAQILTAAAAIGRSFDLATLRRASGRTEDEVIEATDGLMRRGLIRAPAAGPGGEPGYDFAHGAIRDLVEAGASVARWRLLHRRIAESLRADGGAAGRDDPARLARIARHEREAGRDPEAAIAFQEAGDAARRVFANREAIELFDSALGLGHPAVADLHAAIGELATRVGDYDRAIEAFEAAAAAAEPAGLPAIEAALGRAHLRRGDLVAADRHLEAALAGATDDAWRAARLVERAAIRRRAGDLKGALSATSEATSLADRAGDPALGGAARRVAGLLALDAGDPSGAMRDLEAAVAASADDPEPSGHIAALTGLALATAAAGDADGAIERGEEAIAACRRIGDRHLEAAVENHLADLLHAAGRDDEALDHLRRAVEAFAEVGGDPADPDPGIWMLTAS
ncbi:MAG TPA: AAA family ATPase [Candidatus Limnocylindrales bacterium]|nr:AAA family ATPase [Candidatus Limnocylindrales bacterium]